jgi:hypothetical protein
MKTVIVVTLLAFLGTTLSSKENRDTPDTGRFLLEARYLGEGLIGIEGDHLIARIYSDGTVEYEDLKSLTTAPEYYQRTAKLTTKELTDLSKLLDSKGLRSLSESYPSISSTIDHRENLTLRFYSGGSIKQVKVENFKPHLVKANNAYPQKLLALACWAEFARKNARLRFFFRESNICCIEKASLPLSAH